MRKFKVENNNNNLSTWLFCPICTEKIEITGYNDRNYIDNPHTQTCKCGNEIVYIFRKDLTCDIFE